MIEAAQRVSKFLDEFEKIRGLHPDIIHGLHTGVEGREASLTVTDLRELVEVAWMYEGLLK